VTLSKSERILAAIEAALTPTAGISGRVFRDRWEAVARNEMPCIVIEPLGEEPGLTSLPFTDYTITVSVDILISGSPLSTLADSIRVDAHARLMADRTLGGLTHSIDPGPSEWKGEPGEIGILSLSYRIPFRTLTADLTQ
jgi:hypothetical protein